MNNFKYSNSDLINLLIVSIIPFLIWGPFFPDLIVSTSAEVLTIKSGKKGPHIKKGMIDTINRLIKSEFEYLKLFIQIF